MDISQSIENIMDGKDYQRESIVKDGNSQRNSATIQAEEIAISKDIIIYHKLHLIEEKIEGRISRGRPRTTWITDLANSTGSKYYQRKREAEYRNRWHGLVVNLAQ